MADTSVSNINDDTSSPADTDTTSDGLSSETNPTCIGPSLPHTQAQMSGDTSTTYSMGNTPSNDSMDVASSTISNAIDVPENTPSTQIPVPSPSTQITPQSQTPLTDVHTLSVNSSLLKHQSL